MIKQLCDVVDMFLFTSRFGANGLLMKQTFDPPTGEKFQSLGQNFFVRYKVQMFKKILPVGLKYPMTQFLLVPILLDP